MRHRSTQLGRLLRRWRPDRNPLRRRLDRAETAVLGALLVAFLAGAPFAAHAAGSWTYATSAQEARAQGAGLHQVPATLLQATQPWNASIYGVGANARWKAPDGQVRTGEVLLLGPAAAGSTVMVWINQAGQLADAPLDGRQVASRAELSEVMAVTGLAITLLAIGWLVRWELTRRRLAKWDADWLATGPRWSPRR
jgi:hypothetical protein